MDEFKLDMEELKRAFLSSHEKMEKELNERMSIEEDQQQGTTKTSVPIMGNIKSGILNQMVYSTRNGNIYVILDQETTSRRKLLEFGQIL
jgi:hypothetical protein